MGVWIGDWGLEGRSMFPVPCSLFPVPCLFGLGPNNRQAGNRQGTGRQGTEKNNRVKAGAFRQVDLSAQTLRTDRTEIGQIGQLSLTRR